MGNELGNIVFWVPTVFIVKKDNTSKRGNVGSVCNDLLSQPYKEARREALYAFNIKYITNILNENNGNVPNAAKESKLEL